MSGWDDVAEWMEGRTAYSKERSYRNRWVFTLRADGRATRFTEWHMAEPRPSGG